MAQILPVERELADLSLVILSQQQLLQEVGEGGAVALGDERGEAQAFQPGALHPQEPRSGEVNRDDVPVPGEGGVTHRREVVELGVARRRLLRLVPARAQLLVLHLELDLVDLELVQEPQRVPRAARGHPVPTLTQLVFRAAAQVGGISRSGFAFRHAASASSHLWLLRRRHWAEGLVTLEEDRDALRVRMDLYAVRAVAGCSLESRLERGRDLVPDGLAVLLVEDRSAGLGERLEDALPQHLVAPALEQLLRGGVEISDREIVVQGEEAVADALEDARQPLRRLPALLLGALQVVDVRVGPVPLQARPP